MLKDLPLKEWWYLVAGLLQRSGCGCSGIVGVGVENAHGARLLMVWMVAVEDSPSLGLTKREALLAERVREVEQQNHLLKRQLR